MSVSYVNLPANPSTGVVGFAEGTFRVSLVGRIEPQGLDQRILMRFHIDPLAISTGYSSMVKGHGYFAPDNMPDYTEAQYDPPPGSSASSGIYLGRNGWGLDGEFAINLTISSFAPLNPDFSPTAVDDTKLLVTGQSVFVLSNAKLLIHTIGGQLAGLPNLSRDKLITRLSFDSGDAKGAWGNCVIQYG